ncbi:MAG: hypothetical protein WBQ95_14355 [Terracidiphilus sp.]
MINRIQKEPGPIKAAHNSIGGLGATSRIDGKGHDLCLWPPSPNDLRGQLAIFLGKRMAEQDHIKILVGMECHDLFNTADRYGLISGDENPLPGFQEDRISAKAEHSEGTHA